LLLFSQTTVTYSTTIAKTTFFVSERRAGMHWQQTYLLFHRGLGVSVLVALLPVAALLGTLAILRKPAWMAGITGLAATFGIAIFAYKMPAATAVSAAGFGVAFGLLPITWLIFWALVLFRLTVEAGQFEIIKNSIGRLTPDPRLQALLIAFAFGGFLEGAAGFGTPVAIAASMLIGLGFSPFSASAICLLTNTAPVAFGSIGIPIITLAGITSLPLDKLSGSIGAICTPIAVLIPTYLILAVGGRRALRGIGVPLITAGAVFGTVQLLVSIYIGPQLTDILAALAAILAILLVLRLRKPAPLPDADVLRRFAHIGAMLGDKEPAELSLEEPMPAAYPFRTVAYAWMPYLILVVCVIAWGTKPLLHFFAATNVTLRWPLLDDVVYRMPPIVADASPYHALFALNAVTTPGTACMLAVILSAAALRFSPKRFVGVLGAVLKQIALPTVTVSAVLAIAFLMNYCGATATLGLAFATTGRAFPFFSALLGWVGVFLTGSDTSANALFGNLQVVTAHKLGFSPVLMAAANSSGGVMGKMISLQTIAIAAAATGLSNAEQSRLFRFTLKHSILLASLVGCVALVYAYLLHLG
jgi:L-lactate transport